MDIVPVNYNKKMNINIFREIYREEIDIIFNNYIKKFIEDNDLPIVDVQVLYYDFIKFFYITSI